LFRKITGDQIIGAPAASNVNLGGGGTYRIAIAIKRVQETTFIMAIRAKPSQCAFLYEE